MRYSLKLDNPKPFYHETHRAAHFLKFSTMEDTDDIEGVDMENFYE